MTGSDWKFYTSTPHSIYLSFFSRLVNWLRSLRARSCQPLSLMIYVHNLYHLLTSFFRIIFAVRTAISSTNKKTNKKVSSANGRQLFVSTPFLSFILRLSFLSISSCYIVDQPCIMAMMMRMMMVAMMTTVRPNNLCLHNFCDSISRLNISMALLINDLFSLLPIPVESHLKYWYIYILLTLKR